MKASAFAAEAVRVLADNVILRHLRFRRGWKQDPAFPTDPNRGDTGDSFGADPPPPTSSPSPAPTPLDGDGDGMPDSWETQFGLNPASANDARALTPSGYANIEQYLNNTDPQGGATPIVFVGALISRAHTTNDVPGALRVRRTAAPRRRSRSATRSAARR